ncbi:RNA ligase family protein [Streptacidiphilus jiangxiensis]|uniref:RNA ligase n=1 Tax=Streptacidiphilus jiangxiensis TaxID=235985 RepID=A0A1H8BJW7_STRJI|nr:RNA ligase family protein [Streptacidiphilus jiangxiensis]SEM82434.1 RNA ligase [Streptacidiphilus jiangxiensis]
MDTPLLPRYPRTPHLPSSPGATADDVVGTWASFAPSGDDEVIATLKMDGENTTLHRGGVYARSPSGRSRPWQDRIRAFAAGICPDIPDGLLISGENLTVPHSIVYDRALPPFMVFAAWEGDRCLSWAETVDWAELLGLATVPVIYQGRRPLPQALHDAFLAVTDTSRDEGYVLRDAGSFTRRQFPERVAKWVRAGHLATDSNWPASKRTRPRAN